jgi:hypothetical protein
MLPFTDLCNHRRTQWLLTGGQLSSTASQLEFVFANLEASVHAMLWYTGCPILHAIDSCLLIQLPTSRAATDVFILPAKSRVCHGRSLLYYFVCARL